MSTAGKGLVRPGMPAAGCRGHLGRAWGEGACLSQDRVEDAQQGACAASELQAAKARRGQVAGVQGSCNCSLLQPSPLAPKGEGQATRFSSSLAPQLSWVSPGQSPPCLRGSPQVLLRV